MGRLHGIFFFLALLISISSCSTVEKRGDQGVAPQIDSETTRQLTCYFFFISDCPACRNNLPKMVELDKKYRDKGLKVIGVVSDPELEEELLDEALETFGVGFDIVRDDSLTLAKEHGATVTPQAFLYDESGRVIYSGLVDNYYYDFGRHRKNITEFYLEEAIQATLENRSPEATETEPIGCIINFNYFSTGGSESLLEGDSNL